MSLEVKTEAEYAEWRGCSVRTIQRESARKELDRPLLSSAAKSTTASRRLKNGCCRKSKLKSAALLEHKKTRQIAEI